MKLYASDITNLTDARYFAAWGVEYLGFSLSEGSGESLSVIEAKAIIEWLEGPSIIGQFEDSALDKIKTDTDLLEVEHIQVGDLTGLDVLMNVPKLNVWKTIVIDRTMDELDLKYQLEQFGPHSEYIILDFQKNNIEWEDVKSGSCLSRVMLKSVCADYPIVLNINFTTDNLKEIIEDIKPQIINFKGGKEEKIGFKSYDELDDLFEIIEAFRAQ